MNLFDVSWLAVVVAAACGFMVGGIWYGPIMGKRWLGAVGLTEEDIQSASMGKVYGGAFAFSLLASWGIAVLFANHISDLSVLSSGLVAFCIALVFIVPAIGTNYLFSQKTSELFIVDACYWLLFYFVMGLVHGLL